MTLPSIESAYAIHSTVTIRGLDHPEFPALRVTMEALNATEGFLWRFIRGAGLAYGAYVSLDLEAGLLSFSTYRVSPHRASHCTFVSTLRSVQSSNPFQAFQEARKAIQGLADGSVSPNL